MTAKVFCARTGQHLLDEPLPENADFATFAKTARNPEWHTLRQHPTVKSLWTNEHMHVVVR